MSKMSHPGLVLSHEVRPLHLSANAFSILPHLLVRKTVVAFLLTCVLPGARMSKGAQEQQEQVEGDPQARPPLLKTRRHEDGIPLELFNQ